MEAPDFSRGVAHIPTRYPNAWAEGIPPEYYTEKDAECAVRSAEKIIEWVEGSWRLLSGEKRKEQE
ncbi:MAG: hypothetical protein B9J98_05970 [Candidatus Terraquivivens tikiterensis]|uniref:HEPN domain-containing protein n=1 Tax=Candidatus Terraquivivens tikiterensis TaxID=1980982 RepID=A0A2R7Y1W6_9ARCH|nr:MAG: hypothetical protein B9J98_05970 [Candidatus Terraquivivens tikiterensis]